MASVKNHNNLQTGHPDTTNLSHLTHPKYRPDIDGLRTVAVMSVIGFHAFPSWIKGGFVGVDIFFVISGYLISTIIFASLERKRFNFIEFYGRRIRRIFPALIVVLTASYAFGWFALLADEYKQLGKHIAAGAGFFSNFVLWNESGYFDNATETKPLLHLWSLGIEEQFYIVWPLLLWLAWKKRFNLFTITVLVAFTSFILNIKGVRTDAVATFYSPQTRFWELMTGSLLAWVTLYRKDAFSKVRDKVDIWLADFIYAEKQELGETIRNIESLLGATLICIAIFVITKEKHFPGWYALLPTIGAAFIIAAGSDAWLNRILFSNKVMVWFGLISYPLYLWHWPLLSFARIITSEIPSENIRVSAIFLAFVLAWLTYVLIEKPVRNVSGKINVTVVLVALMFVVGIGAYFAKSYDREVLKINLPSLSHEWLGYGNDTIPECLIPPEKKWQFNGCISNARNYPKYALIGDSKAGALEPGLLRSANDSGGWVFIGNNGKGSDGSEAGSTVVVSNEKRYDHHKELSTLTLKSLYEEKRVETVVIANAVRSLFMLENDYSIADLPGSVNYSTALSALDGAVTYLIESGKKVVLVVDNPTLAHPEDCGHRRTSLFIANKLLGVPKEISGCSLLYSDYLKYSKPYLDLLNEIKTRHPDHVELFDTSKILCDLHSGSCEHFKSGHRLYGITDHISDYASGFIGKELDSFVRR